MKPLIGFRFFIICSLVFLIFGTVQAQQTEEQLGAQYYQNKEYDKALAVFQVLFEKNPSQFNYIYYINCLVELKDYEQAAKAIKRQAKQNPTDPRFKVDQGFILIMQGETQKGRKIYEECLKDLSADRNQVYTLTNAFLTRRESDYAIRTYQRGRELLKDQSLFALELAYMYESLGNAELMLDEYLNLLSTQPTQISMVENRLQAWLSLDTDNEKSETFRTLLLKRTQQNPDEIVYAELLLWYSVQQKDFSMALIQAKALDRRYSENGQRIFDLATLAVSNDDYDVALDAYAYIIRKNADPDLVLESRIESLNTEFQRFNSSFSKDKAVVLLLEKKYQTLLQELGQNSATLPLLQNLAHLEAFYLDKTDEATELLESALETPNVQAKNLAACKLELADIYLFAGEQWEATLLYSQVEKAFKNEPLGHEAKYRNAKLSFYIGEFDWAKTQLDILKAATSKLIANDAMELSLLIGDNIDSDSSTTAISMYAKADLLIYRSKLDEAYAVLDSVSNNFPGHPILDDALFKKAEIRIKQGKFEEAAALYSALIKDYPLGLLGDDATFNLASLYETQLNNKTKAMELYENLMTTYPGSLYVVEARKHFRALRNDPVN
ncbi:MAG: tetratricopeptide repeat protein [Bacteroidales bacterium]|nr:tetratricopeptide repeat protein [Bacteroidales bacterium]